VGSGGQVKMFLTTWTAKQTFPAVLVHKPKRPSLLAKPVVPVGAGQDPPDGREYAVPMVDGLNARYDGTFSVLLVAYAYNGTAARTVTCTVKQYEAAGGASSSVQVSQQVTPGTPQTLNGMTNLGEVTLPVKMMAPDNSDSYFTVSVTSGNASDRFLDVLLLSTDGQVCWISLPGSGYTDYWVDAPDLAADIGYVLGSQQDRSQAVSVLGGTIASGGPLRLTPGDNTITVYSPSGMPALEGSYWPRWWQERLY